MKLRIYLNDLICVAFAIIFVLGFFDGFEYIRYAYYGYSILIQFICIIYLFSNNSKVRFHPGSYIWVFCLIYIIFICFIVNNVSVENIFTRIGILLATFGTVVYSDIKINFNKIVYIVRNIYIVLCIIINLDIISFYFIGSNIWPPISYLGYRFAGPTTDPNFLALFSSAFFIICLYTSFNSEKRKRFALFSLLINILFTGALSSFIILPFTFGFCRFIKIKNSFYKQIFVVVLYFLCLFLFMTFEKEIEYMADSLLSSFYGSNKGSEVKFKSLAARLFAQKKALELIANRIIGYGPLQIVSYIGRDTHNSFIGIFFEQGLAGLFLIFFSVKSYKTDSKLINHLSTYLFFSALLLNVHYTAIYSFFLFILNCEVNTKNIFYQKREYVIC